MVIKYHELMSKIHNNHIASVYFFSGEEEYLKEEAIREISDRVLDKALNEFNYDLFYAKKLEADTVIDRLNTLPFNSPRRLVIIKDIESMEKGEQKKLCEYLQRPLKGCCLILVSPLRPDSRNILYNHVSKTGDAVIFYHQNPDQVSQWISKQIAKNNKRIGRQAAYYLQEITGSDLLSLNNEIEKLSLYADDREDISIEDIDLLSGNRISDIFDLTRALGKNDSLNALKILDDMLKRKEEPTIIIGMLARRYRQFLQAYDLLRQKRTPDEIMNILKINKFYDKTFIIDARTFTYHELLQSFSYLHQADFEIKAGKKKQKLALQLLVLNLCKFFR